MTTLLHNAYYMRVTLVIYNACNAYYTDYYSNNKVYLFTITQQFLTPYLLGGGVRQPLKCAQCSFSIAV